MEYFKSFEAKEENLELIFNWLDEAVEKVEISEETLMEIHICVEEIFVNIFSYAYPDAVGGADITMVVEQGNFTMEFVDGGTPYNPLEKPDPDLESGVMERPIGGLGIYMVRQMMDKVTYEYKDKHNCLKIYKTF